MLPGGGGESFLLVPVCIVHCGDPVAPIRSTAGAMPPMDISYHGRFRVPPPPFPESEPRGDEAKRKC